MTAREMLETVQDIKERVVFEILEGDKDKSHELNAMLEEFFQQNWMQILDILDDALYAYVEGKK